MKILKLKLNKKNQGKLFEYNNIREQIKTEIELIKIKMNTIKKEIFNLDKDIEWIDYAALYCNNHHLIDDVYKEFINNTKTKLCYELDKLITKIESYKTKIILVS